MAWNGSDQSKKVEKPGRGGERNPSGTKHEARGTRHGLMAGLIVVVLGGAAVWWFVGRDSSPIVSKNTQHRKATAIAEVTPQIATNKVVAEVSTNTPQKVRKPRKTYVDEKGVLRYEGGMVVRKPPVRTIKVGNHKPSIFKHVAEMQIEGLLEIQPGDMVAGTMDYGKSFTESLKESFKDEIVINADDDEKTREMKQAVIDTKKELKDRMDRGEDVGKLMSDTRQDLQRLGMYRMELENEVRKVLDEKADGDELTEQDVKDCYGAANKMLEEKGIAKLRMPGKMFVRALQRSAAEKKQREQNLKGTKNE